jgi:P-type conjugative transfer protein TrbJ
VRRLVTTAAVIAALAFGTTTTIPSEATAQITVIDPVAIAQAVRQVAQQLQQIQLLETQIANEAAMLRSLGTNVTAPLISINAQATQLLQSAQGIGYNSQNVALQYSQAYPTSMAGASFAQIVQALITWQASSRQTLQQAMATQNQIVQAQPVTANAVQGAVAASQNAPGQTGAIQATNQLLAALSTQLTQLQTILITQARATQVAQAQAQATQPAGDAEHARAFHGATPPAIGVNNTAHL